MRNNLIINGQEAYATYGVVMGRGFIDTLEGGLTLKDPIENDSRLENGVGMLVSQRIAKRTFNLTFNIHGGTIEEYFANKRNFETMLYQGLVDMQIVGRTEIYHLVYSGKSVTYKHSYNGHFGLFTAQFTEPNPTNRSAQTNANVKVIQ